MNPPLRSILRWLAALIATVLVIACDRHEPADDPIVTHSPAVWEIAGADGAVEGWLFGTIHALPADTRWRSDAVREAIAGADLLLVEIAALEDSDSIAATFAFLSHTPGLPPLERRVPPRLHATLATAIADSPYDAQDFTALETWAAAIILARTARSSSDPANGVDKALLRDFARKPIREVEGARTQLGIFDELPEREQRDLLEATLTELSRDDSERQATTRRWLSGDIEGLLDPEAETLLSDPELREALVEGRNRAWLPVLTAQLEQAPRPLIAVGAGHMGGPEGLPPLLRRAGYTVTRID